MRDALAEHPSIAFWPCCTASACDLLSARGLLDLPGDIAAYAGLSVQSPGLRDSTSAKAVAARHADWNATLPADGNEVWAALYAMDGKAQADLLAHCASHAVNAIYEPASRINQGRISAHDVRGRLDQADELARAVGLDMVKAVWRPTAGNYLGRVTKHGILQAVREAKGEASAQLIDHLKKTDMAREAERLLDGSGGLPEPLRIADVGAAEPEQGAETEGLPEFLNREETAEATDGEDEVEQIMAGE